MQVRLRPKRVDWWWKEKTELNCLGTARTVCNNLHLLFSFTCGWCVSHVISPRQGRSQRCQREPMSSSLWWRTWSAIVGRLLLWNRTTTELSSLWILHPQPSLAVINSRWRQIAQAAGPFPHMTRLTTSTCCSTPGAKVHLAIKYFISKYLVKTHNAL